jgi:bifunctional DNA-binding transcriptional regulator/antitoxin component of YhaV-PrlF toxin-antitoxin module
MKPQLFRMKILSKRQVTVPQRLLDILGVAEGDEIQIEMAGRDAVSVHGCKSIPTQLLTDKLKKKLKERADLALKRGTSHYPVKDSASEILRRVSEPKARGAG